MADTGQERLDEIEARANAATVGPWQLMSPRPDGRNAVWRQGYSLFGEEASELIIIDTNPADAWFIAAARDDIPFLLARLRTVEAERDAALAKLGGISAIAERRNSLASWAYLTDANRVDQIASLAALSVPVVEDSGDSA